MTRDDSCVKLPIDAGRAPIPPTPDIWRSTLCRDVMAEIVDGIVPYIDNSAIPRYLVSPEQSSYHGKLEASEPQAQHNRHQSQSQ